MKPYNPNRKFRNKRSLVAIIVVLAVAAVFVAAGIGIAFRQSNAETPEVQSIALLNATAENAGMLGANANFDEVMVKVVFSNQESKTMSLASLMPTGIDKTREGLQNITLTYGNRKFNVQVEVVSADIKIRYVTSGEGGEIAGDTEQSVPAGMSGTEVEAIAAEGFVFAGWSDGKDNPVRREENVSSDTDITIRALFKKKKFIVTFFLADGTNRSEEVEYGDRATPVPDTDSSLQKYGYRFDGWDSDEWKKVTKDVTIRPVLTPVYANYDVYVSALAGEPMGTKKNTTTNVTTNPLNGLNVSEGMDGDYYRYQGYYQWGIDGAVTMEPVTGRVFDAFEVYGATDADGGYGYYKITAGSELMLYLPGAKEKTLFQAGGDKSAPKLMFNPAEGTELLRVRAIFAKTQSVVSFYTYGNLLDDRSVTLGFGETLSAEQLRAPAERAGYEFLGWYTEANVKIETNHAPFYADTRLNARYEAKDVEIKFITDGGETVKSAKYDQMLANAEFPAIPARENYRADGWIVTECATNNALIGKPFDAETKLTDNVTVKPNYVRITYDATIAKTGQGKVYYAETDGGEKGAEVELKGSYFTAKSGASYAFRFEAETESGFALESVRILYASGNSSESASSELNLENVNGSFRLEIVFKQKECKITVENGGETGAGIITILGNTFDTAEFTIDKVLSGMPLEVSIAAPKNMRISGIYLDHGSENYIPEGVFDSYTYRYDPNGQGVAGDLTIKIAYEIKTFALHPYAGDGGSVTYYEWKDGRFSTLQANGDGIYLLPYGSRVKAVVSAAAGKYVSKLTVFGKSADFYENYYESFDETLYFGGEEYFFTDRAQKGFEEKDPRVSEISLYLSEPNRLTEISATFADVYYRVTAESSGYGNVSVDANAVKEGGAVNVTMQTEAGYVIAGYTRINRGANEERAEFDLGGHDSIRRETVGNITTDVVLNVKFERRTYVVLFYNLAESGVSYTVSTGGETKTADANNSPSYTPSFGDSVTYRIAACEGYEIAKVLLLDGNESPIEGGEVTLPVNTDSYDLVLNGVSASRGVKVTLRKKSFELKIATNALSKKIGTIEITDENGNVTTLDPTASSSVTYPYGTVLTVKAAAGTDFYLKSFRVDDRTIQVGDGAEASARVTLRENRAAEILLAYRGSDTGIVIDDAIKEGGSGHGVVTHSAVAADAKTVRFYAEAQKGYVLKALYVNGTELSSDGFGAYSAEYSPDAILYVSAIFEKRALNLILGAENGKLSAEKDYVYYGEATTVYFVANTGYALQSVKLNGKTLTADAVTEIANTGALSILASDTEVSTESVTVTASFAPIAYVLQGAFDANATGNGRVELEDGTSATESKDFAVRYGDRLTFRFVAEEGSYLASLTLNGVAVDLGELTDAVVKTSNGKFASGRFDLIVTGDAVLCVRFDRDVFKVAVTESAGGETRISPKADNDEYGSDADITITMEAYSGYHIAALYVNGEAQPLNLYSADEPNLNTSILYVLPKDMLIRNLAVRAEFERNTYGVKITAENKSPNFKGQDNTYESFLDALDLEYGGSVLTGKGEADRANARYTVEYQGIEHAGAPRATIRPRDARGYKLQLVLITYRTADGKTVTNDYTAQFNENNGYAMILPTIYWDITEFRIEVTRRTVKVEIPPYYETGSPLRKAITVTPTFTAGNETASPAAEPEGNVYEYEYGVRATLSITLTEGFTPTAFYLKEGETTRDFLKDVLFQNGRGSYVTTLTDDTVFGYEAEVARVTLTLTKVGGGSGTYTFMVNGQTRPERTITLDYGTTIGVIAIADRGAGSYLRSVRLNGTSQPLGTPEEDGRYYTGSLTGAATADAEYEVDFEILEYTFRTQMPEGVQGVVYNNGAVSVFPWGTARVTVRIELNQGYELTELKLNGKTLREGEDYVVDGAIASFTVSEIREDQTIVPTVRKKRFTASNSQSSATESRTEIWKIGGDGKEEKIENNSLGNISYGDRIYFMFIPVKNYYAEGYALTMKNLSGVTETLRPAESRPDADNSDIIRADVGVVTGDVYAEIVYQRKQYSIEYRDDAGSAGTATVTIPYSSAEGGDGFVVTIKTNNLLSADGRTKIYYGVRSVRVNGFEYFRADVPIEGWGKLDSTEFDQTNLTYTYRYVFTASDALMSGADDKIGSGTDFVLKLEIDVDKNVYSADEVVVRNLENGTVEETIAQVSGGEFRTEHMSGKFSETIFDGSSDLLELNTEAGYSPKSAGVLIRVKEEETETAIQSFEENAGSQKALVTATAAIADLSNPYRMRLRFVVVIDRNRYDTGLSVVTYEKDGGEASIAENKRGVTVKLDGTPTTEEAKLSKIRHGTAIVMTAGEEIDYDFAGFETYDEQTGAWVTAENLSENGVPIVSIEGRELTVAAVRAFRFRAVYYKKVTVDVVLAPWHKYYSGTYVSGNGSDVNYVSYASVAMTVGGAEKKWVVQQARNDLGIFQFVFRYGDEALLIASDGKQGTNPSKNTTFYLQNKGNEQVLRSVGTVSQGQLRFIATDDYIYDENVVKNEALYVAFDNVIKLNVGTETLGGADPKDGATISYERKASGNNTAYAPLTLTGGKTANVSAFDRIRITVEVQDGYRFESFSRYRAERDSVNLTFLNALETFAGFEAVSANEWRLLSAENGDGYAADSRFAVRKTDGNKIVIEFTVIDNSIYQFNFVKTYEVSGFVSAPRFVGDGINATPVAIDVLSGNKSYFKDGEAGGTVDYGATIAMTVNQNNNGGLFDESKWQFISWYANGVPVKASGIRSFNYYDAYAEERIVLNETYGFAGTGKNDKKFEYYAEFLPIYEIASREYFAIGDVSFRPTSSFEMTGLYYDETGAQVQIPESAYASAVNLGDGSVVAKRYLPFDARKGAADGSGDGKPIGETYKNSIKFRVLNAVSYAITSWRIYYGGYDPNDPDREDSFEVFAGNTQDAEFSMTEAVYNRLTENGSNPDGAYRKITILPIFSKKNDLIVTKTVFFDSYGVPSQNGTNVNNPGVVEGDYVNTEALSNGILSVNYGDRVVLDANPNASYRFIGWFDPNQPTDSTEPAWGTDERISVTAEKPDNTDYTYYYQARYIRTVTVDLSTLNTSGTYVKASSADILRGEAADGGWYYRGEDLSRIANAQTSTFAEENNGAAATIKADVGSYLLFRLSASSQSGEFNSEYDIFQGLVSRTGEEEPYSTATKQADGSWKVVVYLNGTKTLSAQYKTYGTVTLRGLLDSSELTLGAAMSKNLYEYCRFTKEREGNGEAVTDSDFMKLFDENEALSAHYDQATGLVSVRLASRNTSGSVTVKRVLMDDYSADTLRFNFNRMDKMTEQWNERLSLNFSGSATAAKDASKTVTTMPFAGGAGTEENPYRINSLDQFTNIGVAYKRNSATLENVYLKQVADSLTLGANWTPMCADGDGFNGNLDGGGKTLRIPTSLETTMMTEYGGIFAKTAAGSVRQYRFETGGSTVTLTHQNANEGIVAGKATGTRFDTLSFNAFSVTAGGASFGLVAGDATDCVAENVTVTDFNLRFTNNYKGSVFGKAANTVIDNVKFERVSQSARMESQSYTNGSIVGGIVGELTGAGSELRNAVIEGGNIRAVGQVGGAVGVLSSGAKATNVSAVLKASNRLLQVTAFKIMETYSNTLSPQPSAEGTAKLYAAGGLIGYLSKDSTATGLSVVSEVTGEQSFSVFNGSQESTYYRNYPAVSVFASVAGGLVGLNGNGATIEESYIEEGATAEILMPSRSSSSSSKAGSDGIFGGIAAANLGTVYHCGINGGLTNGKNAYDLDNVNKGTTNGHTEEEIYTNNGKFDGQPSQDPLRSESGAGVQRGASVEFLYAAYSLNGGSLQKQEKDGFYYGTNLSIIHGDRGNNNYTGQYFASRGTSTTVMGGIAGFNDTTGRINSSYVSAKVTHFRRLLTSADGTLYSILGGVAGYNAGAVYDSGAINSAIYNYVKPVTDNIAANVVVSTGGVIGQGVYTNVRGLYAYNTATRAINDPWDEKGGVAGSKNGNSRFYAMSAALISSAANMVGETLTAYFAFAKGTRTSATASDVGSGLSTTMYKATASSAGITSMDRTANALGGTANAVYTGSGASVSTIANQSVTIEGATYQGNRFFHAGDNGPQMLDRDMNPTGGAVYYLGKKSGNKITFS